MWQQTKIHLIHLQRWPSLYPFLDIVANPIVHQWLNIPGSGTLSVMKSLTTRILHGICLPMIRDAFEVDVNPVFTLPWALSHSQITHIILPGGWPEYRPFRTDCHRLECRQFTEHRSWCRPAGRARYRPSTVVSLMYGLYWKAPRTIERLTNWRFPSVRCFILRCLIRRALVYHCGAE